MDAKYRVPHYGNPRSSRHQLSSVSLCSLKLKFRLRERERERERERVRVRERERGGECFGCLEALSGARLHKEFEWMRSIEYRVMADQVQSTLLSRQTTFCSLCSLKLKFR